MKTKAVLAITVLIATNAIAEEGKISMFSEGFLDFMSITSFILEAAALILIISLWKFLGKAGLGPSLKIISVGMVFFVLADFVRSMSVYNMTNIEDGSIILTVIGDIFLVIGLYNMLSLKKRPHVELFARVQDLLK